MSTNLSITPISRALGAEIVGLDLSNDTSEVDLVLIKKAFVQYSLIIFRNQTLKRDQIRKIARVFGEIKKIKEYADEDNPEGEHISEVKSDASNPQNANHWHTDLSGTEPPVAASLLYAEIIPDIGGDTVFASMYKAYDSLSAHMQNFLSALKVEHSMKKSFSNDYPLVRDELKKSGLDPEKVFKDRLPIERPLIITHPESQRKSIYISEPHITHITNLGSEESKAILNFLYSYTVKPEFVYRHKWKVGDLIIWDNRCTQHYGVADFYPDSRLLYRISIEGPLLS